MFQSNLISPSFEYKQSKDSNHAS